MLKQESCADRVWGELKNRIENLEILLKLEPEESHEELGGLFDYGLCIDYVEPNTFENQEQGYVRYQLSYGGPQDEFRYYVNYDGSPYHIEYWFMDWFDGAEIELTDHYKDVMMEVWEAMYMESVLEQERGIG